MFRGPGAVAPARPGTFFFFLLGRLRPPREPLDFIDLLQKRAAGAPAARFFYFFIKIKKINVRRGSRRRPFFSKMRHTRVCVCFAGLAGAVAPARPGTFFFFFAGPAAAPAGAWGKYKRILQY